MKRREKLLALALVGVLALWQGSMLFRAFVIAPVEEREADLETRAERISNKTKKLKASHLAAARLKEWKARSLPPDPVVATSLYQNWLVELAGKTLSKPSVTPDVTQKGDAYTRIPVNIEAQATLSRLCDFLYEFRKSGLLHRVVSMTVDTEQHQGDPTLKIKLRVEGLSLKDAPERTTLFSGSNLAELAHLPARDRKDYAPLVARNFFVRGYNGPPRPPPPASGRTPGEEDPREFVRLVGVVSADGIAEVTLRDLAANKTAKLYEGGDFRIAGIEGKVVAIGVDYVTLEIKGETFRLEMGDNLTQLKKLPSSDKTEAGSPETAPTSGAAAE